MQLILNEGTDTEYQLDLTQFREEVATYGYTLSLTKAVSISNPTPISMPTTLIVSSIKITENNISLPIIGNYKKIDHISSGYNPQVSDSFEYTFVLKDVREND